MLKRSSFVFGVILSIAIFGLGCVSALSQNVYYVRAGAPGGNGSDWNNAYASLPATLQRGATYYVSGGSYPSYTFNTAQSGTTVITVKKATVSDHGSDTGWDSSYGTSQAVFTSPFQVFKGYFVLDGQYRNEGNWFSGADYGFKIQHKGDFTHLIIRDAGGNVTCPNVTIKYLYVAAQIGKLGSRPYAIDCDTYSSTIRNSGYVFSRVYVEGSNNPFFVRNTIDPLIEYCASEKTCGDATYHGEVVNRFYSGNGVRGGGVVRYCHFRNCYDGTSGYPAGGGTGVIAISETSGMEIYGNIFESYYVGDGAIAAGWVNNNIKVYNNTFIKGIQGSGALVRFTSTGASVSGNVANNNLAVNCPNSTYNGAGTAAFNSTATTSALVNYAAGDYRLAQSLPGGTGLPLPFDTDFAGNTRGVDGVWDLGAYEYTGIPDTIPPVISNTGASAVTSSSAVITWNTDETASTIVEYGPTTTYGFTAANPSQVKVHAITLINLTSDTVYNYRVRSTDLAGNTATSGNYSLATGVADNAEPTIALTAPASGGNLSNTVTLSATASDNVGIVGVKFFIGGSEVFDDAISPYSFSWDSRWVNNGSQQVYAQARDAAGNVSWSGTNNITVVNPLAALPSPVAYWNFDEGGGNSATDNLANNILTLRNGAATTASGRFGTGLLLDGINDRADAPNSTSLSVGGSAMSVAAWVKLENQNSWQQILVKVKETGAFTAPYFAWHLFGGHASATQWTPMFQLLNASEASANVISSTGVDYGEWVHVVGTYDGATVRIYVNGVQRGSAAQTGNILVYNQPLYIGAQGFPGEFAKGVIDEVRIYSQALSASQVQSLFVQNPTTSTVAPPSGLHVVLF